MNAPAIPASPIASLLPQSPAAILDGAQARSGSPRNAAFGKILETAQETPGTRSRASTQNGATKQDAPSPLSALIAPMQTAALYVPTQVTVTGQDIAALSPEINGPLPETGLPEAEESPSSESLLVPGFLLGASDLTQSTSRPRTAGAAPVMTPRTDLPVLTEGTLEPDTTIPSASDQALAPEATTSSPQQSAAPESAKPVPDGEFAMFVPESVAADRMPMNVPSGVPSRPLALEETVLSSQDAVARKGGKPSSGGELVTALPDRLVGPLQSAAVDVPHRKLLPTASPSPGQLPSTSDLTVRSQSAPPPTAPAAGGDTPPPPAPVASVSEVPEGRQSVERCRVPEATQQDRSIAASSMAAGRIPQLSKVTATRKAAESGTEPAPAPDQIVPEAAPMLPPIPPIAGAPLPDVRSETATGVRPQSESVTISEDRAPAAAPRTANDARTAQLAFSARLIPLLPTRPAPLSQPTAATAISRPVDVDSRKPVAPAAPSDSKYESGAHPDESPAPAANRPAPEEPERTRKSDPAPMEGQSVAPRPSEVPVVAEGPATARNNIGAAPRQEIAEPAAVVRETPSEVPKAPAPAREIRLQIDGPQRVELRMTDRAGDIRVSVRTPDSHLAGALREDLPALASRLEQSGFRSEAWHTGETHGPRPQVSEASSTGASAQEHERHQQGRQDPEEQQKQRHTPHPRKDNRKDFAWLFTSLH